VRGEPVSHAGAAPYTSFLSGLVRGGLPTRREAAGEVLIAGEGTKGIAYLDDKSPLGEAGPDDSGGFLGNSADGEDLERPGTPPW